MRRAAAAIFAGMAPVVLAPPQVAMVEDGGRTVLRVRARMKITKLLYGAELPAAALAWNPYSDRVRMIVLRSGGAQAGQWMAEARDVAAGYRAAFGAGAPMPPISGVAASADTDQTGESVTAWFGDLRLEARP